MGESGEKSRDPCKEEKWRCEEDDPLWRVYVKSYLENERRLERDDRFDQRQPGELARLPDLLNDDSIPPSHCCFPLDTFNLSERTRLPDRINTNEKIRIWRNMKADTQFSHEDAPVVSKSVRKLWPCVSRDFYEDQRLLKILEKRKLPGLLPCQDIYPENNDEPDNFAHYKELGHARIPVSCPRSEKLLLVDRASGDHPGLVDGEYVISELASEADENRVYTQVCLRGTKGMRVIELSGARAREKTWKFCFYQAIVALLAKTQLRYKYATSSNIDYIYDHAWMLFIHIGSLNIKKKLQLDDIVVYNYKYSVEIDLEDELAVPKIPDVPWTFLEPSVKRIKHQKRPELMKMSEELGWEKINHKNHPPIHRDTETIEKFLGNVPDDCHNFILRTCRFSLAVWRDGNFWYIYNPYRCDAFGYWDDQGNACIIKFTSRNTLNRHIVILLLRAYAHEAHAINSPQEAPPREPLIIQLFKITYTCAKIHNLKFLERKPPKSRRQKVWRDQEIKPLPDNYAGPVEKKSWLKTHQIIWTKCTKGTSKKIKWHEYYVEEPDKVFSLWGEIHPTEEIFSKKNRGNQVYACYVVAAGMSRIMAPEYWTPKTMDTVVMCGDRYYTLSRLQSDFTTSKGEFIAAWNMRLLRHFKIGDILFEIDVMRGVTGRLYTEESLWRILEQFFIKHSFGILNCENSCLGIFKLSGAYFMMDVDSVGPPVFGLGDGVGYLVRVTSFRRFVVSLVITIASAECSFFTLHPVEVVKIVDVGP
ncbi:uncharacterized protein LOC107041307 [Diachasma alloeum]|uniref:uncharacterized protein LOC107041307 n=1 Tax=Diachasma alloeum TaxID=454923 RepID=UPI000738209F|nr:uncharacterized protein LOC107041307 [Diachasma alloeum]